MEEIRNVYNILVGKPEGKRQFGRPKHRWKIIFNLDLKEIVCEGGEWNNLA
jgi:hypothetical protein